MLHVRRGGALAILTGMAVLASAAESPLTAARSALEEWVQVRKTLARTRAEWAADKDLLEQSRALLQRELDGLREQLARVETNQASVAGQREALRTLQAGYQEALHAVRARVGALETAVRRLEPVFPPALRAAVQPLLNRLPADPASTNVALLPRVAALISLLNEVDKFNAALTVVEETRPGPDGREIVVDVLYAGLGQAWFVSKSGTVAGVGMPTPDGWKWTFRDELAPAVSRALRMYRNELPAEFVSLPVLLR